jgi:hypothetical protein
MITDCVSVVVSANIAAEGLGSPRHRESGDGGKPDLWTGLRPMGARYVLPAQGLKSIAIAAHFRRMSVFSLRLGEFDTASHAS